MQSNSDGLQIFDLRSYERQSRKSEKELNFKNTVEKIRNIYYLDLNKLKLRALS